MRLQLRGTEELSELNQRLKIASDVVRWGVNHADYLIVNDQIEAALCDFEAILHSECLRKRYSFEKNHKILEDFTSI
jgi:guanylate kinase